MERDRKEEGDILARRRMIDPNFWESLDVWNLTIRQRLLAIGLFSLADDEGRGIADARWLKAKIFPADDEVSPAEIERDLQAIGQHLSFVLYEAEGKKYYAWLNWRKWQAVEKPRESAIPAPPDVTGLTGSNTTPSATPSATPFATPSATPEGCQVRRNNLTEPESLASQGLEGFGEDSGKIRGRFGEMSGNVPQPFSLEIEREIERKYKGNIKGRGKGSIGESSPNSPPLKIFQKKLEEAGYTVNPTEIQQLEEFIRIHGTELVSEAIEAAFRQKRRPGVKYIGGILRSWKAAGLRTPEDVRRAEGGGWARNKRSALTVLEEIIAKGEAGNNDAGGDG
jgi:DnaD/phage-associated family protein